jgi:hypothetical protein
MSRLLTLDALVRRTSTGRMPTNLAAAAVNQRAFGQVVIVGRLPIGDRAIPILEGAVAFGCRNATLELLGEQRTPLLVSIQSLLCVTWCPAGGTLQALVSLPIGRTATFLTRGPGWRIAGGWRWSVLDERSRFSSVIAESALGGSLGFRRIPPTRMLDRGLAPVSSRGRGISSRVLVGISAWSGVGHLGSRGLSPHLGLQRLILGGVALFFFMALQVLVPLA